MHYSNETLEDLLQKFKSALGSDYDKYRNHIYRVFLNCLVQDPDPDTEKKYAVAAVFHDIGIWTDSTFDYLEPSIKQVEIYLNDTGQQDWITEIGQMIFWHHKIHGYRGEHERTVEIFRRADWMDVSLGFLLFGQNKEKVKKYKSQFPNKGFHLFLVKQTVKNFFKHPLNPVPVFKR